jgi:hypothetical protein
VSAHNGRVRQIPSNGHVTATAPSVVRLDLDAEDLQIIGAAIARDPAAMALVTGLVKGMGHRGARVNVMIDAMHLEIEVAPTAPSPAGVEKDHADEH